LRPAPLVSTGCIMMRVCHLNTCPTGVATQDPRLREKFAGKPEHVVNFMRFIAQELREIMAQLGFRTSRRWSAASTGSSRGRPSSTGRRRARLSATALRARSGARTGRPLLPGRAGPRHRALARRHDQLLDLCRPAIERGEEVVASLPVRNVNRVVGTIVGSEITLRGGAKGLPEDTIRLHFQGSAGQSFGAFMPPGMSLRAEGDANDYVGKGLSGGKIAVFPPASAPFVAEDNIIVGNVALYGATSGEVYIRGMAGERFASAQQRRRRGRRGRGRPRLRVHDRGRVVVLGPTGRNFGAGMSGGIAYVLDENGHFGSLVNSQMVNLEKLEEAEEITPCAA
jgi:glutamate synthase (NADPH/NADH) large chain